MYYAYSFVDKKTEPFRLSLIDGLYLWGRELNVSVSHWQYAYSSNEEVNPSLSGWKQAYRSEEES